MSCMENTTRRTTIYLESELHQALKMKAAVTDSSLSDIVNDAVREALAEDADDLHAISVRENEATYDFDSVVKDLRKRGKI